jgi:ABC-2 type transport system ATP-binding protein
MASQTTQNPVPSSPASQLATPLEVRGLTKRFGARVAVAGIDLTVHAGDVYGFLGPNGAGKTTAMRCMLGLLRPDLGTVSIFGDDHAARRRRHVGAIIETPAFHDWMSGRDNLWMSAAYLGLPRSETAEEIERVLQRVGLQERGKDRAGTYSLGMRQRLAIARALLGQPRLLLLDEPTNGLDPRGMREVRELIRSLALTDRITVLISTHLLAEVQAICNRVGILHAGRLQAEGPTAELLAGGGSEGSQVVELGIDPEAQAVVEALEGATIEGPGSQGRLRVRLAAGVNPTDVARAVLEAGHELHALVPKGRSLEDVFMELTR